MEQTEFAMLIKYKDRKFEKEIDQIFISHDFTKDSNEQENGEVFYRTINKDGFSRMAVALIDIKNKLYFHTLEKWDWYEDGRYIEDILSQAYEFEKQGKIY